MAGHWTTYYSNYLLYFSTDLSGSPSRAMKPPFPGYLCLMDYIQKCSPKMPEEKTP